MAASPAYLLSEVLRMKLLLIAFLAATIVVLAADPSGKWSGQITPSNGEEVLPAFLILKADGDKLSGSGGPDQAEQHPMENGRIVGDRLIFAVPAGKGTLHFDVIVNGDEITGKVELKGGDEEKSGKVALKRQSA
jgi:hypothetical protein